MAFALSELFWVGIIPAATAAIVMLLCRMFAVRSSAAWAASVGLATIVGQIGLGLRHGTSLALALVHSPSGARDWLPWLTIIVIGISVLAAYAPREWQRWIFALACVFALAFPIRLLAGGITLRWSAAEKTFVVLVVAAAFLALWTTLALGRINGQPWLRGILLFVVTLGISATITLSGSFTYGELVGLATAAIAGALLAEWFVATRPTDFAESTSNAGVSGAAGPLALALGGVILLAHSYAELGIVPAILLAISVATAAGRLPKLPPPLREGWGEGAFRIALTFAPLAIALVLAAAANSDNPY